MVNEYDYQQHFNLYFQKIFKAATVRLYLLTEAFQTSFRLQYARSKDGDHSIIRKQNSSRKGGIHITMEIGCCLQYAQPYFLPLAQTQDGGVGRCGPQWYTLRPHSYNHLFPGNFYQIHFLCSLL